MIYSHETLEAALQQFRMAYMAAWKSGNTKKSFYCGITNDLDRRKGEHHVENYVTTAECDSLETAQELEELLYNDGFDTGDQVGNGQEDSVFVYMYRKIPGVTNE